MDGEYLKIINALIAHLRQQSKFIADMCSTCPKLSNRWVVMGNVCTWLLEHRIQLMQYFKDNTSRTTQAHNPPSS